MKITMQEFADRYDPCAEAHEWAAASCKTMADVWRTARPDWLVWVATREGVLDDRTLRLFACWCVRQVWHLLTDERLRNAVEVVERYAIGEATEDELDAAWTAAWGAAWRESWAAWAADAAAWSAARYAAWSAAWAAAWSAAWSAAWAAASAAAWDTACAGQAKYLRRLPCPFEDMD